MSRYTIDITLFYAYNYLHVEITSLDYERPYGYKQPERNFNISLKYFF